jgi:hypothetical protein
MYKNIFTRTALDEAIALCAVKPLDRSLFFHDVLLSHLANETVFIIACANHRRASVAGWKSPPSKSGFQHLFRTLRPKAASRKRNWNPDLNAALTADCIHLLCSFTSTATTTRQIAIWQVWHVYRNLIALARKCCQTLPLFCDKPPERGEFWLFSPRFREN